jgi:arylsulfatase A
VYNDWALSFIERHKSERFYLQYSLGLVHYPFDRTPLNPNGPSDNITNFPYMMEYMDELAGKVIDKIEAAGIGENTLIIFAGDNGTDERITTKWNGNNIEGGKFSLKDTGCQVPLLCYWKGVTTAGTNSDLIDFCDFLPTLCELAGVPVPSDRIIDGRSFVPQLRGEVGTPREWVSLQVRDKPSPYTFRKCVRDKKWKLYETGQLYDVTNTPVNERFISISEQTPEDAEARARLQKIIDNGYVDPVSNTLKKSFYQSSNARNSYRITFTGEDVRMNLSPEIGKSFPAKATVYSSNGKKVTTLTIRKGKFYWSGKKSNGKKARAGIYFMKIN